MTKEFLSITWELNNTSPKIETAVFFVCLFLLIPVTLTVFFFLYCCLAFFLFLFFVYGFFFASSKLCTLSQIQNIHIPYTVTTFANNPRDFKGGAALYAAGRE